MTTGTARAAPTHVLAVLPACQLQHQHPESDRLMAGTHCHQHAQLNTAQCNRYKVRGDGAHDHRHSTCCTHARLGGAAGVSAAAPAPGVTGCAPVLAGAAPAPAPVPAPPPAPASGSRDR